MWEGLSDYHPASILSPFPFVKVVLWPEDRACDRGWLLQNIQGAVGLLLMSPEKVYTMNNYSVPVLNYPTPQVNSELLNAGGLFQSHHSRARHPNHCYSWTQSPRRFNHVCWAWYVLRLTPVPVSEELEIIDHIDLPEVAKRGLKLGYTPDVLTDAGISLALLRVLLNLGNNVPSD